MSQRISRRDFLKLLGAGAATTVALTGCGSATQLVNREPYVSMPEYTLPGTSTYYATTCRECPAACGLVVRTVEGRAIKVEGNPNHPISRGNACARGQATVQTLYNPDRLKSAQKQAQRGSGDFAPVAWEEPIQVVQDALSNNAPGGIAFLMGLESDHLVDLASEITAALGAPAPYRYSALGMLEARRTLMAASDLLFGHAGLPVFDIAHAEVTFSFGANFTETWLSPVFYTQAYGAMRKGTPGQRGYLVQFEPRMSQTGANADEWYPIKPGSEALVAQALGALVAEEIGIPVKGLFADVDVAAAARESDLSEEDLHRLAMIFAQSQRRVAIPGAAAMGHTNGLEAATTVLALNALVDNLGKDGGVHLMPESALGAAQPVSSLDDLANLRQKMNNGKIKALFIHGCNPVFELPAAFGFASALENVPLVVAFSSFVDETVQLADYVLPDNVGLESWGYQKVVTGGDRITLSSLQPVVVPLHDTRATADVLLAAVQGISDLASKVPHENEVAFLKAKLEALLGEDGFFAAPEINTLWARWLQVGGWWDKDALLTAPDLQRATKTIQEQSAQLIAAQFAGDEAEYPLHLVVYPAPNLGDGRAANNPWLQETPDPMTTVMWNSWIEINPDLALELDVRDDDIVRVTSPAGSVEAVVYVYPAIRLDTVAIPVGQGHTVLGRYAKERGCNPLHLLDVHQHGVAGNLAFAATRVKIESTGKKHQLARMEDRVGVYGDRYGELYR